MEKSNKSLTILFALFGVMIFLMPLERLGSFAHAGINIRISQILLIIIFLGHLFSGLLLKKLEIKLSKPLIFYICFLLIGCLSLIGAKEKMRGLIILSFLSFMILVPYVTVFIIDNKNKLNLIIRILLLSSALFSFFGLFQFFGDLLGLPSSITGLSDRYVGGVLGFPRVQSTFIEPLYFANYLITPLVVSIFLILKRKNSKKESFILVGLVMLFLLSIILTFSKGAIASLTIVFVGILLFQFRAIFSKANIVYLLLFFVAVAVISWATVSSFQYHPDFDKIYEEASEIMMGGSITERQEAYSVAIEAYKTSPVIGIGVGNFGPYFSGYPTSAPEFGWPIANNEYLEILAEMGILGLVVFLIFILSIFYRSYLAFKRLHNQKIKTILLALNFSFFGILIQYLTFSTLYIMHIWILIGLILATQEIILNKDNKLDT